MKVFLSALLAVTLAGCAPTTSSPVNSGTNVAPSTTKPLTTTEPDNTGVNERDQHSAAKTPIQQNENQKDIQITADIRKAILATEGMSINAQNSKIITADGKVTLRGPVETAAEKAQIEKIADDVAGKGNVTSQLEVKE